MFGRGQLYVGAKLHKVITQNNCYYYRASYALCSLPEHIELSDYHIASLCHRRLCLWLDLYYPEVVYHLILIMPKFRTCYYKYIIAHPVFTARVPIRASQVSPTSSRSSAIMTVVDATLWLIPAFLSISGVPVSKICVWPLCLLSAVYAGVCLFPVSFLRPGVAVPRLLLPAWCCRSLWPYRVKFQRLSLWSSTPHVLHSGGSSSSQDQVKLLAGASFLTPGHVFCKEW